MIEPPNFEIKRKRKCLGRHCETYILTTSEWRLCQNCRAQANRSGRVESRCDEDAFALEGNRSLKKAGNS